MLSLESALATDLNGANRFVIADTTKTKTRKEVKSRFVKSN